MLACTPKPSAYGFRQTYSYRTDVRHNLSSLRTNMSLEVLLLLEELREADNSAVDEEPPNN